jgi:transcriptional regulator with XRE-family HTH domain
MMKPHLDIQPRQGHSRLDSLAGRIRAARVASNLSVVEAARAINVSRTSFSLWESGTVKTPDGRKLFQFSKLTEVSLDWLMDRRGPDPKAVISPEVASPVSTKPKKSEPAKKARTVPRPPDERAIPEIAPNLESHAGGISPETQGLYWVIPQDVIQRSFSAQPGRVVMMQVTTGSANMQRGDYVMIDTTRTKIDEPGMYLLADPDKRRARRALVTAENGSSLKITLLGDGHDKDTLVTADTVVSLGRIMGVFHPV